MNKRIFNHRGITFIEVLAVTAIFSIVAIAAGSFFLSNLFSFNSASNNIALEREAREALNTITDKIRESAYVESVVTADGGTASDEMNRVKEGLRVVYLIKLSDGTGLEVQEDKLILNGTSLINSLDLNGLKVKPLPEGSEFQGCTGLTVNLTLEKKNKHYNIESEAYFRNK